MVVITLLSDFGLSDAYVAQMKAVIYSIIPDAQIFDISHGIEKHSIASGSYILETTVPFFPRGSIHVAVVDPGVGGSRKPILIKCENGVLVGPDNGLLTRAADRLGFRVAYDIGNSQFFRPKVSPTFHGRDIFAYAAAQIASGKRPSDAGPKLRQLVKLRIPFPVFSRGRITCHVLYNDSFGNVVTNISERDMEKADFGIPTQVKIVSKFGRKFEGVTVKSYSEIPRDRFGLLPGSQGYMEVSLKEASAAAKLQVKLLDALEIRFS